MSETKRRLLLSKWHGDQAIGAEHRDHFEQVESVLTDVKYWMHEGMKRDPRRLLRQVEDALQ